MLGILTMQKNLVGRSTLEARPTSSVLIVGIGPCGRMLANELGRRGVSVVMTDEKPVTPFNPQANATWARSLEHHHRLGLADEVRQAGLLADYPGDEFALFHRRRRAADRARVEADDVADTRDRNVWPDRELLQDQPLRDIHGEMRWVGQGRVARQLVDDEGERWNSAIEIEQLFDLRLIACRGEAQLARLSVPAHDLPSLSAPFEIGTSRSALEEQTAGDP